MKKRMNLLADFEFNLWIFDPNFFPSLVILIAGAFLLGFIPSVSFNYLFHKLEVLNARTNNQHKRR
jgi:hypothetical protein